MENKKKCAFEIYRAVAVSMVVLGHFSTSATDISPFIRKIFFAITAYGVPLFFIISGFLLTASFVSIGKKRRRFSAAARFFLLKRILRIYPAYLVSLVILSIYHNSSIFDFVIHFFNVHNLFDGYSRSINGVYWTLAVEFQWYLVAPMLILLFTKNNIKVQIILLFSFVLLSASVRLFLFDAYLHNLVTLNDLAWLGQAQLYVYLYNFIIGIVLYQCRNSTIKIHYFLTVVLILSLVYIGYIESDMLADIINGSKQDVVNKLLLSYVSTFILGAVVFIFLHIEINSIFYRLISYISMISYSLYIYHFPVVGYLENYALVWYMYLPLYLLISIILATISYYVIEAPCLRFSGRLNDK